LGFQVPKFGAAITIVGDAATVPLTTSTDVIDRVSTEMLESVGAPDGAAEFTVEVHPTVDARTARVAAAARR
jgi:hypothetical protein